MKLGDKVLTLVDKPNYSGMRQFDKIIPAHSVGIVGAVKVPRVMMIGDKCQTFNCVDFIVNGKKERAAYHTHEIKVYKGE